jgi:hypothetical protein
MTVDKAAESIQLATEVMSWRAEERLAMGDGYGSGVCDSTPI